MRFGGGRLAALTLLTVMCACSSYRRADGTGRVDRNVITREQLLEHRFTNAFEAVETLRSNWLLTKGTDSFVAPTEVKVYLDNTNLGGIQTLREIATTSVMFIRYFDGVAATARWGLDHGQGVIYVSTRP